jgi:hypothetical protein
VPLLDVPAEEDLTADAQGRPEPGPDVGRRLAAGDGQVGRRRGGPGRRKEAAEGKNGDGVTAECHCDAIIANG